MRIWSKQDDATIREYAARGLTTYHAAQELGVTRNMIIGRAQRIRVHFDPSASVQSERCRQGAFARRQNASK